MTSGRVRRETSGYEDISCERAWRVIGIVVGPGRRDIWLTTANSGGGTPTATRSYGGEVCGEWIFGGVILYAL